jgi:transcriptional regulator with XRE-family HTH domain
MTDTSPSQPPVRATAAPADVAADPTGLRHQVRQLRAEGGTYRSIAAAAGLAPATVHDLDSGRRPPTPATARVLQRVTSGALRRARVDAGGTRLRLRALHVMGHGSARIARALGVREMTIRQIVRGDAPTVSGSLRDAVTGLYDAWWDKCAPERTRAERAAATAARRRAIAGNWCAGAGLDDDELDTPGYKPRSNWMPAAGTGIAPDIRPPAGSPKQRRAGNGTSAPASRIPGEQPWR